MNQVKGTGYVFDHRLREEAEQLDQSYRGQVFTFDVPKLETRLVLNSQWACYQTMANLEDTQPAL
jgi:hypothetical protein